MKKTRIIRRVLISICIVIAVLFTSFYVYTADYYKAADEVSYALETSEDVEVSYLDNGNIVFSPTDEYETGIIFYPGGKVEYSSYAPLLNELASNGILCVLVKMPRNLAILDINAAEGIKDDYPEVTSWYMAGHSLGGACASIYINKHAEEYDGLILLAAYSTKDISDTDLKVLSIYGSEDGVLKKDSYEKNKSNLPDNWVEEVIQGGCHSFFGSYGLQDGDGNATITNKDQIDITTNLIVNFISL